jgi:SAM-dependent methyltransferase
MPASESVDELLASQIDYYRAHAPRYDDWWSKTGKHDQGERMRVSWESEIARLSAALSACAPLGDVLELAGGTGNWTVELESLSDSVTVVDAAPEAVAIAQAKIRSDKVTWVIGDIFGHAPDRRYDTVFFSFWLSHVPPERFEQFWALVERSLTPEGRVVLIDNAHPSLANDIPELAALRADSTASSLAGIDSRTDLKTGVATRLAADGASYDLVKIWRTAEELEDKLTPLGWDVEVETTEWAFIFGRGRRRTAGTGR